MSFEIKGKLIEKYDSVQVTDRFRKREFVIEYRENPSGDFAESIKFQLTQDRCDTLENFRTGEEIKVHFNIRGRRWEKDGQVSYFNNLEAWKIDRISAAAPQEIIPEHTMDEIPPEPSDDLPF